MLEVGQMLDRSPPGDSFDSCEKIEAATLPVKMLGKLQVQTLSASLPHRLLGTNCSICY